MSGSTFWASVWFVAGGVKLKETACYGYGLTIRAVQIEVVHSLDSFINSMRRFIARRGEPEQMRSDTGGNFVRAEREPRGATKSWN